MGVTATELRKNLFKLLDRVADGHDVEVRYNGSTLRIVRQGQRSRLARLIPRGDSELGELLSGCDEKVRLEWEAEQEELLGE